MNLVLKLQVTLIIPEETYLDISPGYKAFGVGDVYKRQEKDEEPAQSVVKALKVRDGSPLDVPLILFAWDKDCLLYTSRCV